jgi:predicted nucleotidyltransferase component of viral defense system
MPLDPIQIREAFHCLVLQSVAPGEGIALRVKGGVNLRFFYGSERYSEDMDLDADPRLRQRLKALLRKTLHAPTLRRELLALGIRDVDLPERPAKDTDTVLRYKLGLIAGGVRYPTKIEVSYRGEAPATWATLARPLSEVVDSYIAVGTTYPHVGHYGRTPAVWQKIAALALRSEVQARDVFDLNVLLGEELDARLPAVDVVLLRHHLSNQVLREAATRALDMSHDQFEDQVAAFLRSDARARHSAQWDAMQVRVASFIERLEQQPKSNAESRGTRP